jgi:hypothetical protein
LGGFEDDVDDLRSIEGHLADFQRRHSEIHGVARDVNHIAGNVDGVE